DLDRRRVGYPAGGAGLDPDGGGAAGGGSRAGRPGVDACLGGRTRTAGHGAALAAREALGGKPAWRARLATSAGGRISLSTGSKVFHRPTIGARGRGALASN